MNKEQQIEEMAHILATTQREDHCGKIAPCQRDCPYYTLPSIDCEMGFCAEALYNSGYRKSEAFSQPHENGGEWIEHSHYNFEGGYSGANYECSVCHFDDCYEETPYCPNCGAKMKGE